MQFGPTSADLASHNAGACGCTAKLLGMCSQQQGKHPVCCIALQGRMQLVEAARLEVLHERLGSQSALCTLQEHVALLFASQAAAGSR